MVLIKVDFPDPDGPQITTTSPFWIEVVQSVKTWKLPYHFETFLKSIIKASLFLLVNFAQLIYFLNLLASLLLIYLIIATLLWTRRANLDSEKQIKKYVTAANR